jgi:hypothetical protein
MSAHTPASQNVVHAAPASHAVPAPLQVSTPPALQRVAPGVHAPVQSPDEQPTAHVETCSHAVPVALHVSTFAPLQR